MPNLKLKHLMKNQTNKRTRHEEPNWLDRHHLGFVNLVTYVFVPHSSTETDRMSNLKPAHIGNLNGLWPRPWLYSRVLLLFAVAFAILYSVWSLEGRGGASNILPGLTIIGALAMPMALTIFFFECNKFHTVPLLRVFQYMLVGSVVAIAITFLLSFIIDWGMDFKLIVPKILKRGELRNIQSIHPLGFLGYHPEAAMAVSALIEEFGKTLLIYAFMMRHRSNCYILQGMLIGAAVGAGFAVFETAGYALVGSEHLLQSEIERGLMAPVCHTAWGAIIGGGTMLIAKQRLRWRMLFNPLFSLTFICVGGLHFLWNWALDSCNTLMYNVQLGIATVFILLLLMWLGVLQVRKFKAQGYIPVGSL